MLFCGNNLNDIDCVSRATCNLQLKSVIHQKFEDVNITGGTIKIKNFYFNQFIQEDNNLLKCDTSLKVISSSRNIPSWIRYHLSDIPISIFSNDINALFYYDFSSSNTIFNANYNLLYNFPNLIDVFDLNSVYMGVEVFENYAQNVFDTLDLSQNSLKDLSDDMVFDRLTTETLKLYISDIQQDSLVYFVSNTISTNIYDSIATQEVEGLSHFFSPPLFDTNNTYDIKNSRYISFAYNLLMEKFLEKNDSYLDSVSSIVSRIDHDKNLYLSAFDLSQVDDIRVSLNNIGISNLFYNVEVSASTLEMFNGNIFEFHSSNTLKCTNMIDFSKITDYGFIAYNSDNNLIVFNENAFNNIYDNCYTIKIIDDITNDSELDTFSISLYLQNYQENVILLKTTDAIIDTNFITITNASTNLLRTSVNLDELSNKNEDYIKESLNILQIHEAVYSNDYNKLINYPTNLSSFENDLLFLKPNLSHEDEHITRALFGIKSLCLQNNNNVDMVGCNLNLDFLNVHQTLCLKEENENTFEKYLFNHNNYAIWSSLNEYSIIESNVYGIVYMFDNDNFNKENNYDLYASVKNDPDATYTLRLLYDMYYNFETQIDLVQRTVDSIRNMFDIQKISEANDFTHVVNIENLFVFDYNVSHVFLPSSHGILNKFIIKLYHGEIRKHFNITEYLINMSIIYDAYLFEGNYKRPKSSAEILYFEFDLPDNFNNIYIKFDINFVFNDENFNSFNIFKIEFDSLIIDDTYEYIEPTYTNRPVNENQQADQNILFNLIQSLLHINTITFMKPYTIQIFEPLNYENYLFALNFDIKFCKYFDIIVCKFDLEKCYFISNITNIHINCYLFNESNNDAIILFDSFNVINSRCIYLNMTESTHLLVKELFEQKLLYLKFHISYEFNDNHFLDYQDIQSSKYFSIQVIPNNKMLSILEVSKTEVELNGSLVNFPVFMTDLVSDLIIKDGLINDISITTSKSEFFYHSVIYDAFEAVNETVQIPIIGFEFELLNFTVNNYYIYVEIYYNVRNQMIFSDKLDLIIYISNGDELFVLKEVENIYGTNSITCILVNNYSSLHSRIFAIGATKTLVFKTNYNI
jgi:hypothetical protein